MTGGTWVIVPNQVSHLGHLGHLIPVSAGDPGTTDPPADPGGVPCAIHLNPFPPMTGGKSVDMTSQVSGFGHLLPVSAGDLEIGKP